MRPIGGRHDDHNRTPERTAHRMHAVVPHRRDRHPNDWCREDQVCWSPATYVPLSRESIHGDKYGDYPQRLGLMARRDQEATVVCLHLNDILIRPGGWPDVLDHCLSLTADEAEQLAGELLETANWCARHHQTALRLESSPRPASLRPKRTPSRPIRGSGRRTNLPYRRP